MAQDHGLDEEIGRLYAAPPGEFVGLRDDLARSLRKDGDRAAADDVKKLRKPTVAAWAVNQLARREKMRLRGLFTAGERLGAAHDEVLGGASPEALERARDEERAAIAELVGAAGPLLEEAGHPPGEAVLDRVRETLHAAVVDEDVGRRVREGRLEREEQATGFGFTALPAATARPKRAAGARPEGGRKAVDDDDAREKRRRAAEERVRDARRAVADAERDVAGRRRELEQAERELDRRRAALGSSERALERARAGSAGSPE